MSQIISISIDLNKLDKSKIVQGKNGGLYYNLAVFVNDTKDQYDNDVSVCEQQTKEQRQAGEKKKYLGNGRVIWSGQSTQQAQPAQQAAPTQTGGGIDDLPF